VLGEHRDEIEGTETDTRQVELPQGCHKLVWIDPGCANCFKGTGGATAFREIGPFNETGGGVSEMRFERGQIGRREDPGQVGVIPVHRAFPSGHGDDQRFGQTAIRCEQPGEFGDCQAVEHGQGVGADE
jgi:hypothetical protein